MTGVPNFHFLMQDLAHEADAGRVSDIEAAGKVAEYIQQALECQHVTFWSVSGEIGRRVMRSVAASYGANGEVWGIITRTGNVTRTWLSSEVTALRKCAAEISTLRARRRTLGISLSTGGFLE